MVNEATWKTRAVLQRKSSAAPTQRSGPLSLCRAIRDAGEQQQVPTKCVVGWVLARASERDGQRRREADSISSVRKWCLKLTEPRYESER